MDTITPKKAGVVLPEGAVDPRNYVGDPTSGEFIDWDQQFISKGYAPPAEATKEGTPTVWLGKATGFGVTSEQKLAKAGGLPMSAPELRTELLGDVGGEPVSVESPEMAAPAQGGFEMPAGTDAMHRPMPFAAQLMPMMAAMHDQVAPDAVPPDARRESDPVGDPKAAPQLSAKMGDWIDWEQQVVGLMSDDVSSTGKGHGRPSFTYGKDDVGASKKDDAEDDEHEKSEPLDDLLKALLTLVGEPLEKAKYKSRKRVGNRYVYEYDRPTKGRSKGDSDKQAALDFSSPSKPVNELRQELRSHVRDAHSAAEVLANTTDRYEKTQRVNKFNAAMDNLKASSQEHGPAVAKQVVHELHALATKLRRKGGTPSEAVARTRVADRVEIVAGQIGHAQPATSAASEEKKGPSSGRGAHAEILDRVEVAAAKFMMADSSAGRVRKLEELVQSLDSIKAAATSGSKKDAQAAVRILGELEANIDAQKNSKSALIQEQAPKVSGRVHAAGKAIFDHWSKNPPSDHLPAGHLPAGVSHANPAMAQQQRFEEQRATRAKLAETAKKAAENRAARKAKAEQKPWEAQAAKATAAHKLPDSPGVEALKNDATAQKYINDFANKLRSVLQASSSGDRGASKALGGASHGAMQRLAHDLAAAGRSDLASTLKDRLYQGDVKNRELAVQHGHDIYHGMQAGKKKARKAGLSTSEKPVKKSFADFDLAGRPIPQVAERVAPEPLDKSSYSTQFAMPAYDPAGRPGPALDTRLPEDASHLLKAEDSMHPFDAIIERQVAQRRALWQRGDEQAVATVAADCLVHNGRDISKSQNLWNPMTPCTCGDGTNAYG